MSSSGIPNRPRRRVNWKEISRVPPSLVRFRVIRTPARVHIQPPFFRLTNVMLTNVYLLIRSGPEEEVRNASGPRRITAIAIVHRRCQGGGCRSPYRRLLFLTANVKLIKQPFISDDDCTLDAAFLFRVPRTPTGSCVCCPHPSSSHRISKLQFSSGFRPIHIASCPDCPPYGVIRIPHS